MNEEKRMAGSYEITHAMMIGDKEIVLGEDSDNRDGAMYICGFCEKNSLFAQYSELMCSDDYAEMVELFGQRILEQAQKTRAYFEKPTQQGIDDSPITAANCTVVDDNADLNGKVIVLRPDALRPEFRRATCQLKLCTGGFGASPRSRGSAVYCTDLYTGNHSRFERRDVLGVLDQKKLPEWAKQGLDRCKHEKAKRDKDAR